MLDHPSRRAAERGRDMWRPRSRLVLPMEAPLDRLRPGGDQGLAVPGAHLRLPAMIDGPVLDEVVGVLPIVGRQNRRHRRQPSAVVSVTFGRTTGTSRMSAWNCMSRLLATIPPSQRISLIAIFESFSIASTTSRLWKAAALDRGAGDMAFVGIARQPGDHAACAFPASVAHRDRKRPGRYRRRRCPRRCGASVSISAASLISPILSRRPIAPVTR